MATTTTFTTTAGSAEGNQYFQDLEVAPPTVTSGALLRRFDTLRYPGGGYKLTFAPTVATITGGTTTSEVQTVTEGGSGLTSFTLTYAGQTTGSLLAAATAAQVQAALVALSNIGVGNVGVTGVDGGPWTVSFIGALADTDVALMTATPTGGTGTVTVATAGAPAGSYEIAITGTNFDPGIVVTVSGTGVTVTNLRRSGDGDSLQATFVVAANATAGARNVTLTNVDGGAVTSTGAFTVVGA